MLLDHPDHYLPDYDQSYYVEEVADHYEDKGLYVMLEVLWYIYDEFRGFSEIKVRRFQPVCTCDLTPYRRP